MSQRAQGHSYRADSGRVMHSEAPRVASHGTSNGTPRGNAGRTHYTIGYAGHYFRLGPLTFWVAVGSLVVMAGWSLATGTYFAFHDDVLSRLIARQKEQQFAYEDRIAELRAQVDRITSRQLLNQEQFEQKLEQVMRRQSTLESRASTLAGVPDPTPTGSIKNRPTPMADPPAPENSKASPISDTVIFTAPPDREARLESRELPTTARRYAAAEKPTAAGVEGALARLQASLDRVETRQTATLNTLEERFDSKSKRIRSVLADLGMDLKKVGAGVHVAAVGGPFVPLTLRKDAGVFERQLYRIHVARANVEKLTRTLSAVPVRKPISGNIDLSSGFGVRSDPFVGRPAMHTGLDFRSSTGDPVRATADGTVESAGWSGGYGKMVEIDHGNGFATRYGHMSEIDVKVGQKIKIGQIVGRVGSTGRSTGPHLHYETRIDGDAVDPQKFLRAGLRLGNAL
ncbi:MAG: peptidoglycan DD-metalloendopeptidase family protein [Hyphomicrobiales bacterium]